MRADCLYSLIGLPVGSSKERIDERIEILEGLLKRNKNPESQKVMENIMTEYNKMIADKQAYDKASRFEYSFTDMVNEHSLELKQKVNDSNIYRLVTDNQEAEVNYKDEDGFDAKKKDKSVINYKVYKDNNRKPKQAKKVKIKKIAVKVIAGVLVTVCAFGGYKARSNYLDKKDANYNVCVSCVVDEGDTYGLYEDTYGLKDIGFSYYELSGFQRQEASHGEPKFVAAGDIIIGRTTKENADKLVAEGKGKIISFEEAVELLGENSSLKGELKEAAMGNSDIVFYVPTDQKTM